MSAKPGGRHRGLIAAGIAVIAVSLIAATVLFLVSSQRIDDVVAGFARAPAGCESRLDFDAPGTYYLFVESRGEVEDLPGDCDGSGKVDRDDDVANFDVFITDADGNELDLDDRDGIDYDTDTFTGHVIATVDITDPGDHLVTVNATDDGDDEFFVAVGRNPDDAVTSLRGAGFAVGLIGLIIGIVLIAFGMRRRPGGPVESPSATPQWATPSWAPATGPPLKQPPVGVPGPPQGPPLGPVSTPPGHLPPPPPGPWSGRGQ